MTRLRDIPLKDWTPLWKAAVGALTNIIVNQFSSEGAAGAHGAWEQLSKRYAEWKRKKYGSKPILQASGALFRSFLEENAAHYEPLRMTYGTDLPYPLYQQTGFKTRLGTGRGKRRSKIENLKSFVPPRRLFDLTQRDADAIGQAMRAAAFTVYRRRGYALAKGVGLEVTPGQARRRGAQTYAYEFAGVPI